MKYRVQNEVAAQMNSWRARRLMMTVKGGSLRLEKYRKIMRMTTMMMVINGQFVRSSLYPISFFAPYSG